VDTHTRKHARTNTASPEIAILYERQTFELGVEVQHLMEVISQLHAPATLTPG